MRTTFTPEQKEYIFTKYETQKNITHLAIELKGKFNLDDEIMAAAPA